MFQLFRLLKGSLSIYKLFYTRYRILKVKKGGIIKMKLNSRRIKRSLVHMLFTLVLIALFLFILKKVIDVFIFRISNESVLLEILQIDFRELASVGLFLMVLLFGLFIIFVIIMNLIARFTSIPKSETERMILFFEKLIVALFPTLLLAGSLNAASFTTITSMISFFAIFSFVFKSHLWEHKKLE